MTRPTPVCAPLGERAATLTLDHAISLPVHHRIRAVAAALAADPLPGQGEVVPAFAALTVFFDPQVLGYQRLRDRLLTLADTPGSAEPPAGRDWVVPVAYDGPDLVEVARATGLAAEEVIRRHTGRTYQVFLIGFVPGFAFLGEIDPALVLPRRETPRRRVPAGSVAIAGAQTGIYPLDTPGGWHLIGRTTFRPFDPAREPAVVFGVGDRVRFEAIG